MKIDSKKLDAFTTRMSPLGYDTLTEQTFAFFLTLATFLISVIWLYLNLSKDLILIRALPNIPLNGQPIYFSLRSTMGNGMKIWYLAPLVSVWFGILRYRFHFLDSRSIYTMKRLGDPRELPKRCFLIPALYLLLNLILALIVFAVYALSFYLLVPAQYILH